MDIEGWSGSSDRTDELAAGYDAVVAGGGVAGLSRALAWAGPGAGWRRPGGARACPVDTPGAGPVYCRS